MPRLSSQGLVESLEAVRRRARAAEARVWLVSELPVGLGIAGVIAVRHQRPHVVTFDTAPAESPWPAGDPRHPIARPLVLEPNAAGRFAAWLQSREELLGVVEMSFDGGLVPQPKATLDAELGAVVTRLQLLWHELDAAIGGGHATLTPQGSLDAACARARAFLTDVRLARLRAALAQGRPPMTLMLGPVRADLTPMDGGRNKRVLVTLSRASRLRVAHELRLSPRQREVAVLAAKGLSASEIAGSLSLGESTVKTHLRHTYETLGVDGRFELAELLDHLL